jgi:type III secretion system YseE family protein
MERQESERFMLLALEEKLTEDNDGHYKNEIMEELFQCLTMVKRHLDSGLPPDEYSQYNKLKKAAEAGISVLERVWHGLHN